MIKLTQFHIACIDPKLVVFVQRDDGRFINKVININEKTDCLEFGLGCIKELTGLDVHIVYITPIVGRNQWNVIVAVDGKNTFVPEIGEPNSDIRKIIMSAAVKAINFWHP